MNIKIYEEKDNPNLVVLIGKSVYQMNYPNHIGGLNMYCGEDFQLNPNQLKEIKLEWMSKEMLLAIINRLLEQINERN
jgi:hypothetical protein